MNIRISIVIPTYKADNCLDELLNRLIKTLVKLTNNYEIILVNDGSPDLCWAKISEWCKINKKIKGINLSRNFGQHYAISAGLKYASGEWVVVMDCDLQDQPEEIINLYNTAKCGYDVVFGKRTNRVDKLSKKLYSKLFYKILSYFTENTIDDGVANFGIYSNKVINNYNKIKEHNRNFPLYIKWLGFKTGYINIKHSKRFAGETSYTFSKMINLAIDSIVAHSNKPLRISIKFGFLMSLLAFIYGLFLITRYFFLSVPLGWTSVMVSLFFIGGLLFANFGLLGLYIGKIFDEVKDRPIFIIKDTINI